jgi:hypothetical protein
MVLSTITAIFSWLFGQVKILYHMFLSPITGQTHKDRLESFYSHQASGYDEFRKKLLHGREDMLTSLVNGSRPLPKDAVWIDFGGGTGTLRSLQILLHSLSFLIHVFHR